jgi:hypothetical protein
MLFARALSLFQYAERLAATELQPLLAELVGSWRLSTSLPIKDGEMKWFVATKNELEQIIVGCSYAAIDLYSVSYR